MSTVEITLTGSYQLAGAIGTWSVLQNVGNTDATVVLDSVAPADTDKGFILKPLDIVNVPAFGDEAIYVKSRTGAGTVVILK